MHAQAGIACTQPTYMSVIFVEIQHTLGDANESTIGGGGIEGPLDTFDATAKRRIRAMPCYGTSRNVHQSLLILINAPGARVGPTA